MKKIIFILLMFPSLVFGQATGKYIVNKPSGGTVIIDTLNASSLINLHQTTAGQTITIASIPSGGKTIDVVNIGSVDVTLSPGGTLSPFPASNSRAQLRWAGSAWGVTLGGGTGSDTSAIHKTGNEVIRSGIKTFVISPSVPTPTLSVDAANKLYVDTKAAAKQDTGTAVLKTGSTLSGNLDFGGNNAIDVNLVKVNNGGGLYNLANNAQINLSAGGNISFTGTGINANTVPYLDASKNLVSSVVTSTQLSYLDATSSIQTQLNAKGSGSVTMVSVASANGFTGTVANPTTTPAITIVAGAITPTSVNSVVLSGSSTPTLAVTGTSTISGTHSGTSSGTNTGDQTNITGNAATVTTNANLTGPITSVGNATSVNSQTGTGSTFVMNTSPTLVTPIIGVASGTRISLTGTGGNGYLFFPAQSTRPNANASAGFVLSAGSTGNFGWKPTISLDTFQRAFSGTLTNTRTYTWQDSSYTVAGINIRQTFSAQQSFSANIIPTASNTYDLGANTSTGDWRRFYVRALQPADVSGTDVVGTNTTISAGNGAGGGIQNTSESASIIFKAPAILATGLSTAQTSTTVAEMGWFNTGTTGAPVNSAALWMGNITPSSSNYTLLRSSSLFLNGPSGGMVSLRVAGADMLQVGSNFVSTGGTISSVYRTTNAGSNVTAHMLIDPSGNVTTGAAYGYSTADGFLFTQGNGTRRIAFAGIKGVNLTSTAGSEAGGLGFFTQTGGAAAVQQFAITPTGGFTYNATNTAAGTTGAQTINKPGGTVNFAAGTSTLVVTNSLATTSSYVEVQVYGTDATATSARVTRAAGSFTITLNAAATAETAVGFKVEN